jgi:exonuclease III
MRIATWNSGRGPVDVKLPRLRKAYCPQFVALQEIAKPDSKLAERSIWKGTNERQGSLIWAAAPYTLEAVPEFECETELYIAARVCHLRKQVFNIVNLWVKPYSKKPKGDCPYGYSLTIVLSRAMKLFGREDTMLLGDTNILSPDSKNYYRAYLADYGLFSAYHEYYNEASGGEKKPTHRHRTHKTEHHIDFCFLPVKWLPGLKTVKVGSPENWVACSDHFPISVEIEDDVVF